MRDMDGSDPPMRDGNPDTEEFDETGAAERSLAEDIEAAIEDGRTYLEAELAYQRTRAAYAVDGLKSIAAFGALGALLALLALVALTVGLVIALIPHLTAWGAAAAVTGLWLLAGLVFLKMAAARWRKLKRAVRPRHEGQP